MSEYENHPVVGLPMSEGQLEQSCRNNLLLDGNTVFLPGFHMENATWSEMVNGRYGLGQLGSRAKEVVAVAGFIIDGASLIITQTPQPGKPKYLRELGSRVLPRLRSRDFRAEMISQLVKISRSLGLVEVLAVPAARYNNVEVGLTEYDYVYDRVDEVLKRCGFELQGQFYILKGY